MHLRQLDLFGADETSAYKVDEVAGEQVPREEELAGAALEVSQVHRPAFEADAAVLEIGDLADRYEQVTSGDAHDRSDDRRVRLLVQAHDEILDAAHLLPAVVDERAFDDP